MWASLCCSGYFIGGAGKRSRLPCKGLWDVCALANNVTPKGWISRSVGTESTSNLSAL